MISKIILPLPLPLAFKLLTIISVLLISNRGIATEKVNNVKLNSETNTIIAIEKANSSLSVGTTTCKECKSTDILFSQKEILVSEECSDNKTTYMEPTFRKLINLSPLTEIMSTYQAKITGSGDPFLSKYEKCITKSFEDFGGPFVDCSSGKFRQNAKKSCFSRAQKSILFSTFEQASDCLSRLPPVIKVSPKDEKESLMAGMFSLISQESGFSTNAKSMSGSNGIGQLTAVAIQDMKQNGTWNRVVKHIEDNESQSCQNLKKSDLAAFAIEKSKKSGAYYIPNSCEAISPENGNPLKNLLFTIAFQKQIMNQFSVSLIKNSQFVKKLSKERPEQYQRLLMVSTLWSHNIGYGFKQSLNEGLLNQEVQAAIYNGDFRKLISKLKPIVESREHNRCLRNRNNYSSTRLASNPSKQAEYDQKTPHICESRGNETRDFLTGMLQKLDSFNQELSGDDATLKSDNQIRCGISI